MSKKILVVEDEEINLIIVEHVLSSMGFSVDKASNGEEAVRLASAITYDLILMDIEMPIMDGIQATKAIRSSRKGRRIPIIALTAHTVPEKLKQISKVGMNGFIVKPFDEDKAQNLVNQYLR